MTEPRYNKRKFQELLLYIAERLQDDKAGGDKKLNKLLFYADFTAYRRLGKPITGAKYCRRQHGPAAAALVPVRKELMRQKVVQTKMRDYYGRKQRVTVPRRTADRNAFEPGELELVDEVIAEFQNFNGKQIEDFSHGEPGYLMVSDGERIPYASTFLTDETPPKRVVDKARELTERYGW
jgi:hypothetical protein